MENSSIPEYQFEQQDYLTYEADALFQYEYATQGQRFFNWLIDNLLMRFALSYITGFAVGYILNELWPDFLYDLVYSKGQMGLWLLGYIIAIFNYIIYYTFCEKLCKGYTLGKLISKTKAIRQDGGELTFKDAFLRSLCRIVPFEVFSGFGKLTWHDQWTKTMIVKIIG